MAANDPLLQSVLRLRMPALQWARSFRLAELADEMLSFNVDTELDEAANAGMYLKNLSHISSAALSCGRRDASFIALRGTA